MNKATLFVPLGVFLLLVILLAAGFGLDDPHKLPSELVGKPLPEFALADVVNPERIVTQADLIGQVSLINIWATWCPNCLQEHPKLMEISREGKVRVIGVNYNDDLAKAQAWLKRYKNPYAITVADTEGKLGIDLGVYGAPETFVLDAEGFIRYRYVGPVTDQVWQETLLPIINEFNSGSGTETAPRG